MNRAQSQFSCRAFLEASTVIVLRAHYTMDVVAAVCAAGGAASAAGWRPAFF
jgi:hypothetical protein